jgi:hypothetical protein
MFETPRARFVGVRPNAAAEAACCLESLRPFTIDSQITLPIRAKIATASSTPMDALIDTGPPCSLPARSG